MGWESLAFQTVSQTLPCFMSISGGALCSFPPFPEESGAPERSTRKRISCPLSALYYFYPTMMSHYLEVPRRNPSCQTKRGLDGRRGLGFPGGALVPFSFEWWRGHEQALWFCCFALLCAPSSSFPVAPSVVLSTSSVFPVGGNSHCPHKP